MASTGHDFATVPPYDERKGDKAVVDQEKELDSPVDRRASYSSVKRGDFTHRKLKVIPPALATITRRLLIVQHSHDTSNL